METLVGVAIVLLIAVCIYGIFDIIKQINKLD